MQQRENVQRLLNTYRATPGAVGVVRRPDRLFAVQLHERAVPLNVVGNALTLGAARRLARPTDAPPLGLIRSLAYFAPVIEEVLETQPSPQYFHHLTAWMILPWLALISGRDTPYGADDEP